jgi:pimeloyl-ACP methyl ester carboxylesterase
MLAYERHGSGDPLVLVHGITHRRQAWYPVLDELAEQREVILVDLPGHGESPALVTEGRPVEDVMREQFKQFLVDQQLDRPHVAGNSLGGLVALIAGAEGDARSVTCLSPAGFWGNNAQFAPTKQLFLRACALIDRLGDRAERLARSRAGRKVIYGVLCPAGFAAAARGRAPVRGEHPGRRAGHDRVGRARPRAAAVAGRDRQAAAAARRAHHAARRRTRADDRRPEPDREGAAPGQRPGRGHHPARQAGAYPTTHRQSRHRLRPARTA